MQGTTLEQVSLFPYLRSVLKEDVRFEKDIRTRLSKALGVSTFSIEDMEKSQHVC